MSDSNMLRAAATHIAAKASNNALLRKGGQTAGKFMADWSTLETKEQALYDEGRESQLLIQLIFVPLGCLLFIGLALLYCRIAGICCFKRDTTTNDFKSKEYSNRSKSSPKKYQQQNKGTKINRPIAQITTGAPMRTSASPRTGVSVGRVKSHTAARSHRNTGFQESSESFDVVGGGKLRHTTPDIAQSAFTQRELKDKNKVPARVGGRVVRNDTMNNVVDVPHATTDGSASSEAEQAKWSENNSPDDLSEKRKTPISGGVFLDTVNLESPHFPIAVDILKQIILELYQEFDADNDGHINHFELKNFFRAVESRSRVWVEDPLTDQEISEVLDAFDDDGNGTLERSEFCTWILSGLSRSPEERKAFADTKPLAMKLNTFLDCVVAFIAVDSSEKKSSSEVSKSTPKDLTTTIETKTTISSNSSVPISTPSEKIMEGHKHWVEAVCVSITGRYAFSGGVDAKIRMWDVATGRSTRKLVGHKNVVTSLACPPKNSAYHVVSGSVDKSVRLWNVHTNKCVGKLKGHRKGVTSVAVSMSNPHIVCSGSTDTTAAIWDARAQKRVRKLMGHEESVDACSISMDGSMLCTASEDGSLRVWDLSTGQCLNILRSDKASGWIYSVQFSPTERDVLCVGTHQHNVEIWNVAGTTGGMLLRTLQGHHDAIMSVDFSPDGSKIVSGSMDSDLRLWETTTGNNLCCMKGHSNLVSSVAYLPNNMGVVSGSRDKMVRIWKV
jgi:WD40 repeat protein